MSNATTIVDNVKRNEESFGTVTCVLLLRIGFLLVQMGSIPIENVYVIVFHNVVEIAVAILSYGFAGYQLSFGDRTFYGFVSYGGGLVGTDNLNDAPVGFAACLIATAITSSAVIARMHAASMLVTASLTSALFLPVLMHWIWDERGWMTKRTLLGKKVSVQDRGGNLVVHVPSAAAAFVAALVFGKRVLRARDLSDLSLAREYASGSASGYFLILIEYVGFPSRHDVVAVNSLMAIVVGILSTACFQLTLSRNLHRHWPIVKCLQGGVAGVVAVSAGVNIYTPTISCCVAAAGALAFFLARSLVFKSVEDCCGVFSIYLAGGAAGALLPGVSATGADALWQLICLLTVLLATVIVYVVAFSLLSLVGTFKNKFETVNHGRASFLRKAWTRGRRPDYLNAAGRVSPEFDRSRLGGSFVLRSL
ncbi:putative ammonium transporter 1 [Cylas formicarius]|uniref:putative ammonium transporter 1 n=1 Tax=Cylas formicarius TaxID=197179 RepID=UPI002958D214|nr:putative ammonium transporter 1 [Cylas formicarius]